MKLKKNIASSETGFIFNPSTGDSFSANPVAAEIILLLKAGKNQEEIRKEILDKYNVERVRFEKDYDDLVAQLRDNNLLEV